MVKLSIIIPYFKTYDLTIKLLDILLKQNTKEIEIILMDDGCYEITFDNLYKDIKNMKIVHQDNMGVALSRNKAIDMAKGKYIAFVDSDDMITEDYIETLLKAIDESDEDIINFNWKDLSTGIEHRKPHNYAPWKAIYKRETISKFRTDKKYGAEDIWYQENIEDKIKKKEYTIKYLDKLLYYYNSNREGSLIWKKTHKGDKTMKYIIMCGGRYEDWKKPKHLMEVDGEVLVERTIRLLKKHGIKDISISTNNPAFEYLGLPILKHENSYRAEGEKVTGYWCDAFYPTDEPTCYIFGDVYFSERAIEIIVETDTDDIEFFGSMPPFSRFYPKYVVEPFALKVVNTKHLKQAIAKTKKLEDEGKFWRKPIMWELWTVIKNVPLQTKPDEYIYNYVGINDYTSDIDKEADVKNLERILEKIKGGGNMIKVKVIEDFTLSRFNEINKESIKRATSKNEDGSLYVGDVFECNKDLVEYLTGNNRLGRAFVEVVEIIPEEIKVEEKPKKEVTKTKTTKKTTTSKKAIAKK